MKLRSGKTYHYKYIRTKKKLEKEYLNIQTFVAYVVKSIKKETISLVVKIVT